MTYDRAVLVNVLVHHWPTRNNGCRCGGVKLGASYPEHIADVYEKALAALVESDAVVEAFAEGAGIILTDYWREKIAAGFAALTEGGAGT